ncbi:type IV pili methyl-accepting chemotaxis transducer N-terminal domain-containing protein [Piscinibacter sp.]|uniref:type IV pili methyl-accepting chemotaxis transducer N-terminal domain-containing protein n=1 Tax=Piscinibacter sp. TaxID=1903157 RepID=UPI002F429D89
MRPRQTLAFRLVATGICFLVVALASIALTLWVTWQLEGGAAAVNEAGRMRMMSYRLALDAAAGNRAALPAQLRTMDATIELLSAGDPSRPLFVPWNDESLSEFAAVRRQWIALRADWSTGVRDVPTTEVDALVRRVDRVVSMIEQRLSRWTDILRGFQLTMLGLAIGSAVLLLYAMHLMVLDPLRRLGQGLGAIRGGDFGARVQVTSTDEFGELAAGFNAMAQRLQSLYGDLEAKVEEKTARLEVKRERLAALYEVSAFVAQAENLDELARGFVSKVRRIAQADAVAVRWSDESTRDYLMLAQEGLPAPLASEEQCLPSGHCHCGQSAATAATRVIAVRSVDGGLVNCGRAGFETLLTVPVSLHHRVLGEIDLFYRTVHELDEDDRSLVETLASHLAGGIESLRAAAADREAAIASERTLLAQELHDSIAQSLAFLKIQVDLLRNALRRGDASAAERTVAEIDTGVRESYADVRELLLHFRTRTNAQDIEAALRSTLQKFEQQTGLSTDLQIEGHGVPLPTDVQVQVLHVVQEALSNVRKHAHATSVHVRVQQTPEWRFEVADDGCGFESNISPGDSHVGLRIMRERAQRIGAQVAIRSDAGKGTRVAIAVPREATSQKVHA